MHTVNDVTVEHVRLLGAQIDAPLARQRLSYLFSSVSLHPSRMSPSSVLVVRAMRDPLPGGLATQLGSAASPSPAWERAALARLDAICEQAVRPARSLVPPSADAVMFADTSELLACLAIDCTAGTGLAWWWKSVLRHQITRGFGAQCEMWPLAWAEQPLYVPGAIHHLNEQQQAVRVLERITPSQAWKLLFNTARAFGLPPNLLMAARDGPPTATENAAPRETRLARRQGGVPSTPEYGPSSDVGHSQTPPWEPYLPNSAIPAALGMERRALLGVSLLLHRAPVQAASTHFALRMRSWLQAVHSSHADGLARAPKRHAEAGKSSPEAHSSFEAVPDIQVWSSDVGDEHAEIKDAATQTGQAAFRANEAAPALRGRDHPRQISKTADDRLTRGRDTDLAFNAIDPLVAASLADPHAAPTSSMPTTPQTAPPEATQIPFEDGCRTGLGGVFYLVHLLLRSDLLSFDVGLRGWALLELLARCLFYRRWTSVGDDPIWDALAQLDLREPGTHPGAEFTAQDTYRAPESWLRALDGAQRCARYRSGRLEVWLAEGFPILDTAPAVFSSHARMTRRQRRAFREDASVCAMGLELSPELRRFLHFVLPYVRWRLRRALGGMSFTDILQRPATLYITHTHVDLVMRMKQISVPARLAGLDANPGWTPELGRIIKFHFVDDLGTTHFSGGPH